jgi:hypothetical protein
MKIYFPDDKVKQDMLEALIKIHREYHNDGCCADCNAPNGCYCISNISARAIESATGKTIDEVMKD